MVYPVAGWGCGDEVKYWRGATTSQEGPVSKTGAPGGVPARRLQRASRDVGWRESAVRVKGTASDAEGLRRRLPFLGVSDLFSISLANDPRGPEIAAPVTTGLS